MRRSSLSPAKADEEMDFGYATTVDDAFDAPPAKSDWTEDDVEEGRPLLRVGSWYCGGVCVRLRLRPIGATVARQIPVLKVTRSNRVSVTEVWADLCRRYTHRSKDAPRSRRAKILACCAATVIFGPKASLFAGAAAVVTWSRHRAARVEAALGGEPTPAPTPAPTPSRP